MQHQTKEIDKALQFKAVRRDNPEIMCISWKCIRTDESNESKFYLMYMQFNLGASVNLYCIMYVSHFTRFLKENNMASVSFEIKFYVGLTRRNSLSQIIFKTLNNGHTCEDPRIRREIARDMLMRQSRIRFVSAKAV